MVGRVVVGAASPGAEQADPPAEVDNNKQPQQGGVRKRRLRRKRNKKKSSSSLIPPIPAAKNPSRSDRHVARDLYLALRCSWKDAQQRHLDRVCIFNWEGDCIMDCKIADHEGFVQTRKKIVKKIEGKVLIGHGLDYCLYSLQIQHPWANLRDGASYLPFMKEIVDPLTVMVVPRGLSDLTEEILGRGLDTSSSDILREEGKACIDLYRAVRLDWENEVTKLIQQKERQREVRLEPREGEPLESISEYAQPPFCDAWVGGAADYAQMGGYGPPVSTFSNSYDKKDLVSQATEDQSTQAPTELSHDEEDTLSFCVRDDLSVRTSTSTDQQIWMPRDKESEDVCVENTSPTSSWGLWLPRPSQESTHPIDADDWLDEGNAAAAAARKLKSDETERAERADESCHGHLPSRLLNDSSSDDSDHEVPVREESSHFVEGTDWLDQESGARRSSWWPGRGRRVLPEAPISPRRLDDEWIAQEEEASPKFSFFRKKSQATEDQMRSNERTMWSDGQS